MTNEDVIKRDKDKDREIEIEAERQTEGNNRIQMK